jgi:hypothetical protein
MARLPTPGGDDGTWGGVLNDYLLVAHNADGTLVQGSEIASAYIKPSSGIPSSDLSSAVQSDLSPNSSYVQTSGATMTGDLIFPATGYVMYDGAHRWRVTINTSGTLLTTQIS